jgi:hypothetical protein
MKLYGVYDGTKYVGEMTIDQISDLTGKTRSQVSRAVYSAACSMKDTRLCMMDGTQSANRIKTI